MARRFAEHSAIVKPAGGRLYSPEQEAASVASWSLNGNTLDTGPNGLNLIETITPTYLAQGGAGLLQPDGSAPGVRQAIDFDNGTGDLRGATGATWDPLRDLNLAVTVMGWLYVDEDQDAGGTTIISQGLVGAGASAENIQWMIGTSAKRLLAFWESGSGSPQQITTTKDFHTNINQWNHFAMARNVDGKNVTFYRNGYVFHEGGVGTAPTGGGDTVLGVGGRGATVQQMGQMCGLAVFAHEMEQQEVCEHYYYGSKGI